MMKLYDLVQEYNWDYVGWMFRQLYPDDDLEGHEFVFHTLKGMKPRETRMRIVIEMVYSSDTGEFYANVTGRDGRTWREELEEQGFQEIDEASADEEVPWGLDFREWAEWLGMEIDPDTWYDYAGAEILCHCLWEMTFFGFNQEDIHAVWDEIEGRKEDYESRKNKEAQDV